LEGYQSVVENMHWYDENLTIHANYSIDQAIKATKELLDMDHEIDGIFAANDLIAIGSLKAIHSTGLNVPNDMAVIGFDGISLTSMVLPELSTIKQPVYEMGTTATNVLLNEIEDGGKKGSLFKEFDVTLIQRESTAKGGWVVE